ncbi:NAD-dependent epimerase/dehydratase family protein [Pseudomonas syringae]|uniref:NAD-dependent epimerase/dehydratase family protein n=1 Tax=Pseudomonas syringae TaxID=317 RepID=UPI001CA85978|nr:NAD-dependent epimerase/dehydratase family protein [Pseudomonas syringae]MCI3945693.1 NAD-dependent epimerase/dehydratase family protein [Pseudomonas syringae]
MTDRVLVTGGGGFVACHLIQQLLANGSTVNTTVRHLAHTAKVRPLLTLQKQYPGRLHLFEADLLAEGAFDLPMRDCSVVHHVASPFLLPEKIKDGRRDMLEPALQGTRNVLQSVGKTPSVTRVIMTSTVGAIFGDYIDVMHMKNKTLSEDYFNTSSTLESNPYHYAKVEAEKEAWRLCEAQSHWRLVTINPGMILGPSLTPASDSGSLFLLDEMFRGYFFYGMPDLSLTTVDVRDVAKAHINAAHHAGASGRYILAEQQMMSFVDIARIVRRLHRRPWLLPRYQIPNAIVRMIGPFFGLTQDYLSKHLSIRFVVDNRRSVEELGITYRSIKETLTDHYRSWELQRQLEK